MVSGTYYFDHCCTPLCFAFIFNTITERSYWPNVQCKQRQKLEKLLAHASALSRSHMWPESQIIEICCCVLLKQSQRFRRLGEKSPRARAARGNSILRPLGWEFTLCLCHVCGSIWRSVFIYYSRRLESYTMCSVVDEWSHIYNREQTWEIFKSFTLPKCIFISMLLLIFHA